METIERIKLPLIKDYLKIIRSLASQGRNFYHKYLILPLSSWNSVPVEDSLENLTRDIQVYTKIMDPEKLARQYKRALCRSVEADQFDLTVPGSLCMDYLRAMQDNVDLANCLESLQLVNLLRKPFSDYSDIEYRRMNSRFENELSREGAEGTLVEALAVISSEADEGKVADRKLSDNLLLEIKRGIRKKDMSQLKKECISYLLRASTPRIPELHRDLEQILAFGNRQHPGFRREVYESAAVIIYRETMSSIKSGDIRKTVLLISKYTVIFRGDPSTPHYHEFDAFEKMFFDIIERKNLWESI